MKDTKLDAPLRVYWDINYIGSFPGSLLEKNDILKVADEVIACRPFYVNLGEDILNFSHLKDLLEKFKTAQIMLSLSSSSLVNEVEDLDFLKEHKVDFLEFKLDPHIDEIKKDTGYLDKIKTTLDAYAGITKKVCPSLIVTGENYVLLPVIIDFLAQNGVKYFKMPNTVINERTVNNISQKHMIYEDVAKLGELITDKVDYYKSKMEFFIHDLFIFEIFFPVKGESKQRAEYDGCQAGNALCYIDHKGDLYLCSSLYMSLGSLLENSIRKLFKSEKRLEFKKMIDEQHHEKCVQCADFSECKGGCRGIVYFLNDSFLGLDPLCPYSGKGGE